MSLQELTQFATGTENLFQSAYEYQEKLFNLQSEINQELVLVKTAISEVLKKSTKTSLCLIEDNSKEILNMDQNVRSKIEAHDMSIPGLSDLVDGLNAITNTLGFAASNKLKIFDRNVDALLKKAAQDIGKYSDSFEEIQQIVVQSFIGSNLFSNQEQIIEKFKTLYEQKEEQWQVIRPNINSLVRDLTAAINLNHQELRFQYEASRNKSKDSYIRVEDAIEICLEFKTLRAMSAFSAKAGKKFNVEDFIPKLDD